MCREKCAGVDVHIGILKYNNNKSHVFTLCSSNFNSHLVYSSHRY